MFFCGSHLEEHQAKKVCVQGEEAAGLLDSSSHNSGAQREHSGSSSSMNRGTVADTPASAPITEQERKVQERQERKDRDSARLQELVHGGSDFVDDQVVDAVERMERGEYRTNVNPIGTTGYGFDEHRASLFRESLLHILMPVTICRSLSH